MELEIKQNNGIKRVLRKLQRNDNLFELSGNMEQYRGLWLLTSTRSNTVSFSNGPRANCG